MAKNLIAPGNVFDVIAPGGGVVSGTPYLIGDLLLICLVSGAAGAVVSMAAEGVYELTKFAAGSGAAIAQGQKIYWDDTAKKATYTDASAANKHIGWAYAPATTTATSVQVKLLG